MSKEYKEYFKEEKQLYEKKKQFKWQIREDLNAQINYKKDIIVSDHIRYNDNNNMYLVPT